MRLMQDHIEVDAIQIEAVSADPFELWTSNREAAIGKLSLLRGLSRQPLIHFLVAGLVLFGVATLVEHKRNTRSTAIHVSAAEIRRLVEVWSRQYGRSPSPAEVQGLISDYVREEVYYREALASGLDQGDSIIRRRLVEKMEFLSQEIAGGEPDEEELQAYFERNPQKFEVPAQMAFSHIYFSPAKHGAAVEDDARAALAVLSTRGSASRPEANLGDAFMLQREYPLQTRDEVKSLFGEQFAIGLFALAPGQWQGPIQSSYGLHLVRVTQFTPSHVPQLAEVRSQVLTDFKNERLQAASEAYYARLRERYRVDVDGAALATALSGQRQESRPAEKAAADED